MLKILQPRLQQHMNQEIPDVQAEFRKGRGTKAQIAHIPWIIEKAREFQKNIYFCFIDYAKLLTVWITTICEKFLKRWEYQTTLPAFWETWMQAKKQHLELDMKQWTGSKLGKKYISAVYCHPAYLTSMQSTLCKMPGWRKLKLMKIARRNNSNLRYADGTILMAGSEEEVESLDECEREDWKGWPKTHPWKKPRSWHPVP